MSNNKQLTAVEFIPYQLALELKQLGFDEPCFGTASDIDITLKSDIKMPLFQQAFRFFREKYDMSHSIDKDWDNGHLLGYEYVISEQEGVTVSKTYHTYEEAELACLRKLIEIVKGGNNEQTK
jgi:hypothetical protein